MEDITRNGVAGGKHDVEQEGNTRTVYDEVVLGTYDNAADGNGNAFNIPNVYGFSRLKKVDVQVADGSGYKAAYDYVNDSIRVFAQANDGTGTAEDPLTEVAAGTALNITLRIEARGMG